MTHRDEDEEIIDSALDTLAWQRREINRLKGDVERLREAMRDAITEIETGAPLTGSDILSAALGEE